MNHAIYCYSNGYFNPDTHLESVQQELAFQEYLDLLCEMQENRPNAVRLLCGTLYDKARLADSPPSYLLIPLTGLMMNITAKRLLEP